MTPKYYKIGQTIFPEKWLRNGHSICRDGDKIVVGSAQFVCANEHAASRAFNRIAALVGAEDLCALLDDEFPEEEEEGEPPPQEVQPAGPAPEETRWKPAMGELYWAAGSLAVFQRRWDADLWDQVYFDAGYVFKTEAEAKAHRVWRQETQWKPGAGERYWTFVGDGQIVSWQWQETAGDLADQRKFAAGLVFRTRAEAQAALAMRRTSGSAKK